VTAHDALGYILAFIACAFAAMNVVGGYVVTGRMLKMFKRSRTPVQAADSATAVSGNGQAPASTQATSTQASGRS
jgi:NAD(P) transhydrogenase subunit alpha